ncbi:unnamed protein product [Allacma fusca]|uniref:Transmembrane protein n=1 Tax=Allacma fusca TaxID=39272 RepID=A0A8J2J6P0_9HEXA|nr:unnamed protein product [Allacma fusca]
MFHKLVLIALFISIHLISTRAFDCETTDECKVEFGEDSYFECTSKKICECSEFFVLDPTNSRSCLKGASFNQTCTKDIQCTFILGASSFCNPTISKCDCKAGNSEEVAYFNRRCFILKKFGESCSEDLQCILDIRGNQSSNPLGKCLNGQCGCLIDDMTNSWNSGGSCITCENCTTVEISLFAIMGSATVALILFVYVMYRVGTHKKKQ